MLRVIIAGRLGKDASLRSLNDGTEICGFAVAADVGFGDRKQTYWVDVSKFGKGAKGLAGILRKGTAVTVVGELTMRENEGKTYLQCRADDVTLQGGVQGEARGGSGTSANRVNANSYDDLDDAVPFVTSDSVF